MTDATVRPEVDLLAGICCPLCNKEGQIRLSLSHCFEFRCDECEDEFSVTDLEARIAGYRKLIKMAAAAKAAATTEEGE